LRFLINRRILLAVCQNGTESVAPNNPLLAPSEALPSETKPNALRQSGFRQPIQSSSFNDRTLRGLQHVKDRARNEHEGIY
jgi:hypothetical protein